jgi:hypothetical protein
VTVFGHQESANDVQSWAERPRGSLASGAEIWQRTFELLQRESPDRPDRPLVSLRSPGFGASVLNLSLFGRRISRPRALGWHPMNDQIRQRDAFRCRPLRAYSSLWLTGIYKPPCLWIKHHDRHTPECGGMAISTPYSGWPI